MAATAFTSAYDLWTLDEEFQKRATTALVRHAHYVLGQPVSDPPTAAQSANIEEARKIIRSSDLRLYLRSIASEPNLDGASDTSVESKVQTLFARWAAAR
jgi:hypothetical protein